MGLLHWIKNRKSYESVKEISFFNLKNFFLAKWNRYLNNRTHIKEQVNWRLEQVRIKSPECFEKKECFCGCDLNGLLYQPSKCMEKNECFPALMNKKDWKTFKNDTTKQKSN